MREPLQSFDIERELPERERPFGVEPTRPVPLQIVRQGILGSVDDPQALPPAALHGRLQEPPAPSGDEVAWFGQSWCLSKDYERLPATGEAMIYGAMSRLMLRRLARAV